MKGWMKLFQRGSEEIPVEVGIYLGSGNAFMAEHFLYRP